MSDEILEVEDVGPFKYVSENHLRQVLKHVRRIKREERDEEEWLFFLEKIANPRNIVKEEICSRKKSVSSCNILIDRNGTIEFGDKAVQTTLCKDISNDSEEKTYETEKTFQDNTGSIILQIKAPLSKKSEPSLKSESTTEQKISKLKKNYTSPGATSLISDKEVRTYTSNKSIRHQTLEKPKGPSSATSKVDLKSIISCHSENQLCRNSSSNLISSSFTKFKLLNSRLSLILDNLHSFIENFSGIIDEEDMPRKRDAAQAFSSRFTRNYLYNLNKQVHVVQKSVMLSRNANKSQISILEQKLRSSFQCVLNALQAFERFIQTGCLFLVMDKLFELLILTLKLLQCNKHELVGSPSSIINEDGDLNVKIESILKLLENQINENKVKKEELVEKESKILVPPSKQKSMTNSKSKIPHQLSMYYQKKRSRNFKTRLKTTSGFELQNKISSQIKLNDKNSCDIKIEPNSKPSERTKSTRTFNFSERGSDLQDDHYKEMDYLKISFEELRDANFSTSTKKILVPRHYQEKDVKICEKQQLKPVKPVQLTSGKVWKPKSNEIKPSLSKDYEDKEHKLELNSPSKCTNSKTAQGTHKKAKNVELICIVDNKDCLLTEDMIKEDEKLNISDQSLDSIMKYKVQYELYCNQSPLYNVAEYPWESLEQISETLCDDILLQVTDDLELDCLIKKLYDLEFT